MTLIRLMTGINLWDCTLNRNCKNIIALNDQDCFYLSVVCVLSYVSGYVANFGLVCAPVFRNNF